MASSSSSRPAGPTHPRAATPNVTAVLVKDALATWAVPVLGGLALLGSAALGAAGVLQPARAIVSTVAAALVLLAWIALRPVGAATATARDRLVAALVAPVWLAAAWLPFWLAVTPSAALGPGARITPAGPFPATIAAGDAGRVELVVEAELPRAPNDGPALPVSYQLALGDGTRLAGTLDESRRGAPTAAVRAAAVHALTVPADGILQVTAAEVTPDPAPALTVYARRARALPWWLLGLGATGLLALAIAVDRRAALRETDGALTLATGAAAGAAAVLLTSRAAEPTLQTLAGAAILGGAIGYAIAALTWWLAKQALGATPR